MKGKGNWEMELIQQTKSWLKCSTRLKLELFKTGSFRRFSCVAIDLTAYKSLTSSDILKAGGTLTSLNLLKSFRAPEICS